MASRNADEAVSAAKHERMLRQAERERREAEGGADGMADVMAGITLGSNDFGGNAARGASRLEVRGWIRSPRV